MWWKLNLSKMFFVAILLSVSQGHAISPKYLVAQADDTFDFDDSSDDFSFEDSDDMGFDDFSFDTESNSETDAESYNDTEAPAFSYDDMDFDANEDSSGITEQALDSEIETLSAPPVERVKPKETNRHYFIKHPNQKHGLYKIAADGKYYYRINESPRRYGVAVKGGAFLFNNLVNPRTGTAFKEVYGTSAKPTVFAEYLWPFFKKRNVPGFLKSARLKLGAGFIFADGTGQFADPVYADVLSPEKYNFLGVPIEVGLQYSFEFYDRQIFVPYVAGALSYMLGLEIQDGDFGRSKFLGHLGAHISGGVALSLGWLEEAAKFDLDSEFGINQTYFTLEIRQNAAIQTDFDFTSTSVVGGLWLEF